jgi:amino acid transporter
MIGWAAFVMPATTFLPVGGILGSSLAFLAAGAAMVIIALNYHYLSNLYPSMSGIYNLVKVSGNRRQAFTASWAMGLAHLCCIPLNARVLGMLVRTILEEFLHIEFRAYFFQSNTLLVEAAVVVGALLLFGFINVRGMHQTPVARPSAPSCCWPAS